MIKFEKLVKTSKNPNTSKTIDVLIYSNKKISWFLMNMITFTHLTFTYIQSIFHSMPKRHPSVTDSEHLYSPAYLSMKWVPLKINYCSLEVQRDKTMESVSISSPSYLLGLCQWSWWEWLCALCSVVFYALLQTHSCYRGLGLITIVLLFSIIFFF